MHNLSGSLPTIRDKSVLILISNQQDVFTPMKTLLRCCVGPFVRRSLFLCFVAPSIESRITLVLRKDGDFGVEGSGLESGDDALPLSEFSVGDEPSRCYIVVSVRATRSEGREDESELEMSKTHIRACSRYRREERRRRCTELRWGLAS